MSERAFVRLCQRQQTDTPEAAVRGAVAELQRKLGVLEPPVPLRPILNALRVDFTWSERSFERGSGVASLLAGPHGYRIAVHEPTFRKSWRRMRFTLAHEIVHVMLFNLLGDDDLIRELDCSPTAHRRLERLCNVGAAELLAPAHWLRTDLRAQGVGPTSLLWLYDRYLISREVLIWRIAEVLPRSGVFKLRHHARHNSESICWRVVRSYPGYDPRGLRPWLPEGATSRHVSIEEDDLAPAAAPRVFSQLSVELNGRSWRGRGITSLFPGRSSAPLPLFEGLKIADDKPDPEDEVLLFILEEDFTLPVSSNDTTWHRELAI